MTEKQTVDVSTGEVNALISDGEPIDKIDNALSDAMDWARSNQGKTAVVMVNVTFGDEPEEPEEEEEECTDQEEEEKETK